MKDNFYWLQKWYNSQCNGDWEHGNNIRISTLDNPGWSISINLEETKLQDMPFQEIKIDRTENDWLICFLRQGKFEGRCGPINLSEVIEIFHKWAES